MHSPTSVSHHRQSTSSPTSLEESTEVAHALYHHPNDAQSQPANPPFDVVNLLQPRDEAQRVLWEDEANKRATGRHELQPRSDHWATKGWTIYNAHGRQGSSWRKREEEPKTPVQKSKQPALPSARADVRPYRTFFTIPDQAEADTGKSLHVGVSEALVEAMQTRYSSPSSAVDLAVSPCPSRTPSLTYSDGSDSGEEDMPSIDLDHLHGSPLSGNDDCLIMDYESSSSAYYYGEVNQYPPQPIQTIEAEIANLNAVFRAKQEDMDVVQKADLLFMEFINIDSCTDVPMDY
ncbi:hypothetical protein D9619_003426 [Psilocybe cf. subviscida]|uniref:Uncharacterized protein n=1 Tax=Psilocybe cf. subviscida TaxID=2480587 RepID=A0A8H5AXS7_9AGAR|nr:hypothetical protein D9619_003426 [Psilocybe cf. subviscida]